MGIRLRFPLHTTKRLVSEPLTYRGILEARVGIEPTHKGFADLSLTTWVPRLCGLSLFSPANCMGSLPQAGMFWSGRPGSNRRHLPWQGSTLPLSYSRSYRFKYNGRLI